MTKKISGEKYGPVTLFKIIPILNSLTSQMKNFSSEWTLIQTVKDCFLRELKKRLGQIEKLSTVAVATILEPRFKNTHFQDPVDCTKAIEKIR